MFSLERADLLAGSAGFDFADHSADFVKSSLLECLFVKRRRAGEQLVQQHAQRIDVAARIDIQAAQLRLLGTHVHRRPDHLAVAGVDRLVGQVVMQGLGHAKVDDFDDRAMIGHRDHDVGRFQVAVDDPFLMGMLDGVADINEQFQPLAVGQLLRNRSTP